jgi:hypothetical protein
MDDNNNNSQSSVQIQTRLVSAFCSRQPLENVFLSGTARVKLSSSTSKKQFVEDERREEFIELHPFQVELILGMGDFDFDASSSKENSPSSSTSRGHAISWRIGVNNKRLLWASWNSIAIIISAAVTLYYILI